MRLLVEVAYRWLERCCPARDQVQFGVATEETRIKAGPAAAAGPCPGAVSDGLPPTAPAPGQPTDLATGDWTDVRGGRPELTEELLLAAANQVDECRRHTHFNHPRHEYLGDLSHKLRSRAVLFARNR